MSEDDPNNQVVPVADGALALTNLADNKILSEMVGASLVLAKKDPRPRIVVLDDEPFMREMHNTLLRNLLKEVTVLNFQNGDEAWRELSHTEPDVLITDLLNNNVPGRIQSFGMSGYELLLVLAQRKVKFPILVVSGSNSQRECLERIQLENANLNIRVLPKPFKSDDYRKALELCVPGFWAATMRPLQP